MCCVYIGISCNENANGKWKQIKHCVAATVVFFTRELSASVLGLWWFLLRAVHTPASTRANRWGHTMQTVYCEIILNPLKRLIRLSNEMKFGKNHLMPKDKYSPHSRRGRRRRVTGIQPTSYATREVGQGVSTVVISAQEDQTARRRMSMRNRSRMSIVCWYFRSWLVGSL